MKPDTKASAVERVHLISLAWFLTFDVIFHEFKLGLRVDYSAHNNSQTIMWELLAFSGK